MLYTTTIQAHYAKKPVQRNGCKKLRMDLVLMPVTKILALVVALVTFFAAAGPNQSIAASNQTAVAMQIAMQRHIERSSVNGALLNINQSTGELVELFPLNAHPMILQGPGHYVLCAEMQDRYGNNYPVDFYMVETGGQWQVFRTVINDRGDLQELHRAGVYTRF